MALPCLRTRIVVLTSTLLAACAAERTEDAAVEEQDARVVPDAGTAEDARLPTALADATAPPGGDTCIVATPSGEFSAECEDAAVPDARIMPDANTTPDARVPPDASAPPDASEPEAGVCESPVFSCRDENTRPRADGASCSISASNDVDVRFRACEECGSSGGRLDIGLQLMRCGGCSQIFAESGAFFQPRVSTRSCTEVSYRTSGGLQNTAVPEEDCFDVYAGTQSTIKDDASGTVYRSPQRVNLCRCSLSNRTCTLCAEGGCPDI